MTSTYDMTPLELDTQVQLLSRVQFLTRFSSNLIRISGQEGSGKSWLSEKYLESWASEPIQSLLICNQQQKDHQHRSIILGQLVRDGVFNEQDTLLQSLEHMLEDRACHLLVVVDDSHLLSDTVAAELWSVVQEAQQRQNWQINVLLFGQTGMLNGEFSRLSTTKGQQPLTIEISPLSDSERDMFIDVMMVNRQLDAAQRRKVRQDAQSLPSLPGALKGLGRQETSAMEDRKDTPLWPLMLLALLLIVVGAGSVWWFWPQSDDSQRNNALIPQGIDELTEFVEKLNQADDESSDSSASANTQPNSNQVVAQSGAANSEEVNTEASNQQTSNVTAVTTGLVGTTPNTGTKATQTGDKTVGRQTSSGTSAAKPPTSNAAGTATNSANTSTKLNVTTAGITAAGGSGVASSSVGVSGSGGSVTSQSGVNTNSGAVITTPGQGGAVGRDAVYVNADQQTEDDFELPEQLVQQGVTVGRGGDENKRIVVPDTVVDAIIDQQAAGSDGTAAVNALLPELANAVSDVTQGTSQPKVTRVGFTTELANQALLQVSEDRFALQLAALQSREAVDTFISELDLAGKVNVYETRRNGDPWFMVLLGDYASVTEARKAGLVLPDDIQALSPWAKAFTQIHQEIRRVN